MATRLAEGLYRFELRGVNGYFYDEAAAGVGEDRYLVDAGTPWDADRIRAGVADAGYALADVDRVLVTHYDLDHVGALAKLTPALEAPVVAAEPDASYLTGERKPPLTNHKGAFQRATRFLLSTPHLAVERVADGDAVGSLTAYHTPGHTPGHVAYVDERVGFLGDLVSEDGGELDPSPWVISYDTDAVAASVRSLAERAPDFEAACTGHGDPLTEAGKAALERAVESL